MASFSSPDSSIGLCIGDPSSIPSSPSAKSKPSPWWILVGDLLEYLLNDALSSSLSLKPSLLSGLSSNKIGKFGN